MSDGVVECAHCGEVTLPNRRADGSVVCSCAAGRALVPPADPPPPPPGEPIPLPRRPR